MPVADEILNGRLADVIIPVKDVENSFFLGVGPVYKGHGQRGPCHQALTMTFGLVSFLLLFEQKFLYLMIRA